MKVEKEQLGPSTWSLTIEIPAGDAQAEVEEELVKLQKESQMPGFRKGKVPLSLIKKRFEKTVQMEVLRDKLGDYYSQALDQSEIGEPIAPPELDIVQFESDKPLILKAKVEVQPPIELANYDSLTVVRETVDVGDNEIDLHLERLREKQAVLSDDLNPAGPESLLEADLQELDAGYVPIIGHKREGITIDLSKAAGEFRDPLIGIEVGQSRNISITKPPISLQDEKQMEHWQVNVKAVKKKEMPELNDDFAKEMGPDINDMTELREAVKKSLEGQISVISYQRMSHLLAHQVVDNSKLDVPEMMLNQYLDRIVSDARKSNEQMDNGKFDEEFVRNQFQDRAVWNLKWYLLRHRIAEVEGLEINDDDLDKEYERLAKVSGKKLKQVKAAYSIDNKEGQLKDDMLEQRVLQYLVSKAKVVERAVSFEDFFARDDTGHHH